jgi:putative membrane protein
MIRGFSDHAANERTFLAWIRTGIAVLGFGFVIEKFNLFLVAVAASASAAVEANLRLRLERLAGPLGRYDGLALMLVGIGIMVIGFVRYMRAARLIDAPESGTAGAARGEVILAAAMALLAAAFCVYLVVA